MRPIILCAAPIAFWHSRLGSSPSTKQFIYVKCLCRELRGASSALDVQTFKRLDLRLLLVRRVDSYQPLLLIAAAPPSNSLHMGYSSGSEDGTYAWAGPIVTATSPFYPSDSTRTYPISIPSGPGYCPKIDMHNTSLHNTVAADPCRA